MAASRARSRSSTRKGRGTASRARSTCIRKCSRRYKAGETVQRRRLCLSRRRMRLLLVLVLAPALFAQTAADRVATPPPHSDAIDDLLKMVGAVPASEAPHTERFGEFALATVGPVPILGEAAGAG